MRRIPFFGGTKRAGGSREGSGGLSPTLGGPDCQNSNVRFILEEVTAQRIRALDALAAAEEGARRLEVVKELAFGEMQIVLRGIKQE